MLSFYHRSNDFRNVAPRTVKTKTKKIVCKDAAKLCNKLLTIFFNDYSYITDKDKKKWIIKVIFFFVVNRTEHLYTAFLNTIKLSEYIKEIKFDKDLLAIKQNNYLPKILIVYIVYGLDA